MAPNNIIEEREYRSGEIVEPGTYVDIDSGTIVRVQATDEVPEGSKVVRYRRKFRRLSVEPPVFCTHR